MHKAIVALSQKYIIHPMIGNTNMKCNFSFNSDNFTHPYGSPAHIIDEIRVGIKARTPIAGSSEVE